MILSAKAQNTYPNKQVIGQDTVICSTVEQQKKYLLWKNALDECAKTQSYKDEMIELQSQGLIQYERLSDMYEVQEKNYKSLVKKQDEIVSTLDQRNKVLEIAYKDVKKELKVNKIMTGLSYGVLAVGIGGLFYIILR